MRCEKSAERGSSSGAWLPFSVVLVVVKGVVCRSLSPCRSFTSLLTGDGFLDVRSAAAIGLLVVEAVVLVLVVEVVVVVVEVVMVLVSVKGVGETVVDDDWVPSAAKVEVGDTELGVTADAVVVCVAEVGFVSVLVRIN